MITDKEKEYLKELNVFKIEIVREINFLSEKHEEVGALMYWNVENFCEKKKLRTYKYFLEYFNSFGNRITLKKKKEDLFNIEIK
jgi:hypothetical protein